MEKMENFLKERKNGSYANLELPKPKTKKWHKFLLWLLITGLVLVSGYYFYQYKKIKNNLNVATQEENKVLLADIGKIIELPQDETPTVATVSDKDKLKEQDFFKSSENGDKILIYSNYKMAILYRPSVNKIIKVAPLVMDQNSAGQNEAPANKPASDNQSSTSQDSQSNPAVAVNEQSVGNTTQQNNLNVVIYNGTKIAESVKEIKDKLVNVEGINISDVAGDAKKNNYTKTEIIDLTHRNTDLMDKLAQAVGGEVVSLPDGEAAPEGADVFIITGK